MFFYCMGICCDSSYWEERGGVAYWYMEQDEEIEKENKSNVKEKL